MILGPSDIRWVRGGLEDLGRIGKIAIALPADVRLEDAPPGRTLSEMLADGTIDALIAPRIVHLVGVRRALVEAHLWLPATVLKAFEQAKMRAIPRLSDTSATKVTMPFVVERLKRARGLIGRDYWPYGVSANRHVLGGFPCPPSRTRTVASPGVGRRAISSVHPRGLPHLRPRAF
jgi:4,5-dihydroxyphthalate decarboxylase